MEEKEPSVEVSPGMLLALMEEARSQIEAEVREAVEQEIRDEYAKKPVRRGVLGFLSWVAGLVPDSNGKPSGSWTLYLLSHSIPLIVVSAWAIALLTGISLKAAVAINPFIVLTPVVLSWAAWLAHHKKVAAVAVTILDSLGRAIAGIRGANIGSVTTVATNLISPDKAPADPSLKPGERIPAVKRPDDKKPKTDPSSLEVPPAA